MTDEHEHIVEDLAAYALESVDGLTRARIAAHVATCATCARRLEEYRAVVGALPMGLTPVAPPPTAWAAIRAGARERRPRASRWAWPISPWQWLPVARWPAVAALVALLVVWNATLQRELTRRSPGPAPGPEVEALSRRPGRIVILQGRGTPGASGRIFVAVDGGGHLAVSGLAPLPRDRTYQLWFVRTGSPAVSGAAFGVDPSGRAWAKITVPATLDDVRAITVTEEHAPGSAAPTGTHLLDALPWR